jgi:uncharacterized protein (TIGR00369 family)
MSITDLDDDGYCFACGKDNPIGLKMEFLFENDEVTVKFTPKEEHQGWKNVIHGGILATLMDEAMARVIINSGYNVVTSSMDMRFLRPAKSGEEITITGKINRIDGKNIYAVSKILNGNNKTVASSRGTYVKIS